MKNWIFLTVLLMFPSAFASENFGRGQHVHSDPDVADVRIVMADIGHTRDILNVFIKCHDKRTRPNAVEPQWEQPVKLTDLAICMYRPRRDTMDKALKLLNVHYSRFKIKPNGELDCGIHENTMVDLRRWCHAWQPGN